jgi:hypothetical protein
MPSRLGLGCLLNLDRKLPVQVYERQYPGGLIRFHFKNLDRFLILGHRITENRHQCGSTGVGDG